MNETLRMFWRDDRESVAKAIRELLQFDVPCVGRFEDAVMVQRTDLKVEEEVLVLLHYAGEAGFTRRELGQYVLRSAPRVSDALKLLMGPSHREIVFLLTAERYRLTDLGAKRVREQLADKLLTV